MTKPEKILVIKLGALGDFVQALGPMAAIRRHHPDADITLLTTKPFEALAQASGYFDHVQIDRRPKWFDLSGWWDLRRWLRQGGFSRVYDLQNNDRTAFYLQLFGGQKPEWVGAAPGASHCNASPERTAGLAFHGHVQTLALAGIDDVAIDDLSWLVGKSPADFGLEAPYVLMVPGSAPQHPYKRWPAQSYAMLATGLAARGVQPVILGTAGEKALAQVILGVCPQAVDLTGQTVLQDLPGLARGALAAVGNDTGPMHLVAPTGCPTLVLFSQHSNPARHAPLGARIRTVQKDNLADLTPADILERLDAF